MGVFGIERASYFQPEIKGNVFEWASLHGYSGEYAEMAYKRNNINEYFISDVTAGELALNAVEKLNLTKEELRDVEYVIYFHTLQTSAALDGSSVPAAIAEKIGAKQAKCFSIAQQNCVNLMMIFKALKAYHASGKFKGKAIIVGADVVMDEGMRLIDGMQMESDGAAALLVTVGHDRSKVYDIQIITHGEYYAGMDISSSGEGNNATADRLGYLLLSRLGKRISKKYDKRSFDFIIPHNVNPTGLIKVAQTLGVDREKIFLSNVSKNGHHYGCDNIINYLDAKAKNLISNNDWVLWMAVGMGRTYGACVIQD
ncbi:hypothetical protein OAP63_00745 [Vibrio sp.]|nr:hypothetical protein [Vibrio sp.]